MFQPVKSCPVGGENDLSKYPVLRLRDICMQHQSLFLREGGAEQLSLWKNATDLRLRKKRLAQCVSAERVGRSCVGAMKLFCVKPL